MLGSKTLSLAIAMPDKEINNDFWHKNYPQAVDNAEKNNWMWKSKDIPPDKLTSFAVEMAPYIDDPFRGAKFRRFQATEEKLLLLEKKAAMEAIKLADISPENIDLVLCATFPPDEAVIGNASILAAEIGCTKDAWNIESACSGWSVAFTTAHKLIQAGQYQNILIVTSNGYSKTVDLDSTISWGVGDAATATVVVKDDKQSDLMGTHGIHTGHTYGAVRFDLESFNNQIQRRLRVDKSARYKLGEQMEDYIKNCVFGALKKSRLNIEDIQFFVFSNPLAWYPAYCAKILGIKAEQTINTYPLYANIGATLPAVNLFHALYENKIRTGDYIVICSIGSVSSVRATVLHLGDVKIGKPPSIHLADGNT